MRFRGPGAALPAALLCLTLPAAPARAQAPAPPAVPAPASARGAWLFTGSWRARQELWDWFGTGRAGEYTFTGSVLRLAGQYRDPRNEAVLELQQTTLLNLPRDASLAPPLGQLGQGAAYRDANGGQQGTLFVKQAYWRARSLGSPENSLRLGRFEFQDGAETSPADPTLAWLKRERIAQRLLGGFAFTHVGRSFDGGQLVRDTPGLNLTLFGGMPTEGVFDLDGGATLTEIQVGYAAATRPFELGALRGEGRLFGLYYHDGRDAAPKVDSRPAAALDADAITLGSFGGHLLATRECAGGRWDGLLWGVGQLGSWGALSHRAFSVAAEAGFQPRKTPWNPWLRAGFSHGSGDDDPTNGSHGTFFNVLPTPRPYARFPFYNQMNLNDLFGEAVLRPQPQLTLRAAVHRLWLAEAADLWYLGGGAFQNTPSFGYGGRPSGGDRGLATVLDLGVEYRPRKQTTLGLYVGYAAAGTVIKNIYGSRDGLYSFLELTQRW